MRGRGAKNIILILLLATNIFFIFNIAQLNLNLGNIPMDMIENAAEILSDKGILVDIKNIEAKKPVDYIYEGIYSEDLYKDIAQNLAGVSVEEINASGYIMPDGAFGAVAYNAGGYKFKFADNLQIEILRENYEFDYDYNNYILNSEINNNSNNKNNNYKTEEKIIKDFLKKYHEQDLRLGFKIINVEYFSENNEEKIKIIINQTADNILIDGHVAYLEIVGEEIKYFSGRWYFGIFTARYKWSLLDSVNILFKCLEKDGRVLDGAELLDMQREYNILVHERDKFYLRPSWALIFKDGRKFSYNMITGDKN